MRKLDGRWFVEDRVPGDQELTQKQKTETDKALRNSTLLLRRLKRIIDEDIEKTYHVEEDFDDPAWERKVIAAAAERKTLRRLKDLLP